MMANEKPQPPPPPVNQDITAGDSASPQSQK